MRDDADCRWYPRLPQADDPRDARNPLARRQPMLLSDDCSVSLFVLIFLKRSDKLTQVDERVNVDDRALTTIAAPFCFVFV